jgi:hypothetical protein
VEVEILQYIRRAGRRAWLVPALPVLCLAVAVPVAAQRADRYTGTVTVPVEAPSPDAGPAVVRQNVESFATLADAEQVLAPVAEANDLSLPEVRAHLDVDPRGTSNLVAISFQGGSAEQAAQVPQAVATGALALFHSAAADVADQDVEAFGAAYDEAVAALREYATESGSLLPEDAYRQAAAAQAAGGQDTARTAQARDRLLEYQLLQAAVDRASNQLASAQAREVSLRVRAEADADSEQALLAATPQRVDETPFLVQVAAGAVLAGLLLAGVLLVLTEALGRRRRTAGAGIRTGLRRLLPAEVGR